MAKNRKIRGPAVHLWQKCRIHGESEVAIIAIQKSQIHVLSCFAYWGNDCFTSRYFYRGVVHLIPFDPLYVNMGLNAGHFGLSNFKNVCLNIPKHCHIIAKFSRSVELCRMQVSGIQIFNTVPKILGPMYILE